jgi:hypothetical protein
MAPASAPASSRKPAPSSATRAALKAWSRPSGSTSSGTPCASARSVVPSPPCVMTAAQRGSSASWSPQVTTSSVSGVRRRAPSAAGPSVSVASRPASAIASHTRWIRAGWPSMTVVLKLSSTRSARAGGGDAADRTPSGPACRPHPPNGARHPTGRATGCSGPAAGATRTQTGPTPGCSRSRSTRCWPRYATETAAGGGAGSDQRASAARSRSAG